MTGTLILTENNIDKVIDLDELEIPTEDYPGEHEGGENNLEEEEECGCEDEDTSCDEECDCECHDNEELNFDLNSQLGKYDFAVILKTENLDINILMPEPNYNDPDFNDLSDNYAQNAFLANYINHALNNEEWINEFSLKFRQGAEEKFSEFLKESGFTDMLQELNGSSNEENFKLEDLFKKINKNFEEDKTQEEKYLDFEEEFKKLNKNKPKIIT